MNGSVRVRKTRTAGRLNGEVVAGGVNFRVVGGIDEYDLESICDFQGNIRDWESEQPFSSD